MTASVHLPPVNVSLTGPPLAEDSEAGQAIRKRIETEISGLLHDLGIDAQPQVQIEMRAETAGRHSVSLSVGGAPVRFPREIIAEASAYVDGETRVTAELDEALTAPRPGQPEPGTDSVARLGELLAHVCYCALSGSAVLPFSAARDSIDEKEASGVGEQETTETADSAIGLCIERDYLSSLIAHPPGDDLFQFLRSGLFAELGLLIPQFRICPDSSLNPRGFRFRINAIRTLPCIGLTADTILVNDTAERLAALGFEAVATLNPATWKPGALVSAAHKDSLEELDLTTWDPWGFLILSLAAALRNHAHRFITRDVTTEMLRRLGMAFPDLARLINNRLPVEVISSVLRELLLDGIPIRNLRQITELLLRFETIAEPERDLDRLSFVRAGMADVIANKLSRGTGTVMAYVLDPQAERALLEPEPDRALPERLLAATQDELSQLPPTAWVPSILTQPRIRARIRDMLRGEFPYLSVVGHGELPANCNVQPIARISLP